MDSAGLKRLVTTESISMTTGLRWSCTHRVEVVMEYVADEARSTDPEVHVYAEEAFSYIYISSSKERLVYLLEKRHAQGQSTTTSGERPTPDLAPSPRRRHSRPFVRTLCRHLSTND